MSSVVDPTPEPTPGEELVAYLDGELPPDDCRRIEERLAADADYRQQLRDLDQAWEALDVLPTRKANDDFARTTMELVTVAAQADATAVTATVAGAKRRRKAWFAAAALAGALLGFVLAWLLLPNRNNVLLKDLAVIRRADTLRQVESVDFLRRLSPDADQLMSDEVAIENELAQMASLESRRKWVESLPAEDKVVLAAQAKDFAKLSDDKKERLRALQKEISAGGVELERTLLAYDQWLARLTAGQQEDLRQDLLDRPVDGQVNLVRRLVRQESEQAARRLSPEDAETLRNNLRAIAADQKVELLASPQRRGEGDRTRRPNVLTIISRELFFNEDARNDVRDRLTKDLSPKAQAQLDSLFGWRRNAQLWRWVLDSLQTKVDSDELERFFAEKLSTEQREQLLSLPPNEMQTRLERLYYASELGYGDVAEWYSQFREGGWPPNRPGGDRRGFRPDGPPGERGRREGPEEFRDGERMQPRPGGPPRPRDEDFRDGRRPPGPFGQPPDGPPRGGPDRGPGPGGPRPDGPPPRDGEDAQEEN